MIGRVLFGMSVSAKAVVAGPVLRRAGVKLEQILDGDLADGEVEALADALRALKAPNLLIDIPVGQAQPRVDDA